MKKILILISFLVLMIFAVRVIVERDDNFPYTQNINEQDQLEPIQLVDRKVDVGDGNEVAFKIASGFDISVAAEGLGKARFMTMSSDERMFVPDMVDYNLSNEGRVIILSDFNEESKVFESRDIYLSGLRGPHNIAFYTDEDGDDWLYLTLTEHLVRYPYKAGDISPSGNPEIVFEFPNTQSEGADGVVWHITRTAYFHGRTLYVSIGSGCNACEEDPSENRAVILAMDPDGENVRTYAEGIKNAVGMGWVNESLYATENGSDHLGDDAPNDTMFKIEEGRHYGWPYCYYDGGDMVQDDTRLWVRQDIECGDVARPFVSFDPHSAPLGFEYFNNAHQVLRNSFLVALQGSFNPSIGTGYEIVRVSSDGNKDVFMEGFLQSDGERAGRPVDILQRGENSFFISDDFGGRIYYIFIS